MLLLDKGAEEEGAAVEALLLLWIGCFNSVFSGMSRSLLLSSLLVGRAAVSAVTRFWRVAVASIGRNLSAIVYVIF